MIVQKIVMNMVTCQRPHLSIHGRNLNLGFEEMVYDKESLENQITKGEYTIIDSRKYDY